MSTAQQQKPTTTSELIESRIDKAVTSTLRLSDGRGGLDFANIGEVMEFSKIMAISVQAVPPHCRNQIGVCLAIALQAIEWRMSPYAVANKSYVVNDRVAWEAQLIHAVIEQRAPLTCRLRHDFSGEGAKRRCRVWATVQGESEPLEYTSPEFSTITPKNSPLWKSKPDLQLFYNTSRDWARVYFPDVIMGIYSDDELTVERIASPSRSLDDLTARITDAAIPTIASVDAASETVKAEQMQETEAETSQGEPESEAETTTGDNTEGGTADDWSDFTTAMNEATSLRTVRELYEKHFNPESETPWTIDQQTEAVALRDAKVNAIKAAPGGKPATKQGSLVT